MAVGGRRRPWTIRVRQQAGKEVQEDSDVGRLEFMSAIGVSKYECEKVPGDLRCAHQKRAEREIDLGVVIVACYCVVQHKHSAGNLTEMLAIGLSPHNESNKKAYTHKQQ